MKRGTAVHFGTTSSVDQVDLDFRIVDLLVDIIHVNLWAKPLDLPHYRKPFSILAFITAVEVCGRYKVSVLLKRFENA